MSKLSKRSYIVSEVNDIVTNDDSDDDDLASFEDDEEPKLILFPPIKCAEYETDCDSDTSDDFNEGLVHHIPRRITEEL